MMRIRARRLAPEVYIALWKARKMKTTITSETAKLACADGTGHRVSNKNRGGSGYCSRAYGLH